MKKSWLLFIALLLQIQLGWSQNLVSFQKKATLGADLIDLVLGASGLSFQYGVTGYSVEYLTTGTDGELDTASGLVVLPDFVNEPIPTACFQHGTVDNRYDVPSELKGGWQLAVALAARGYLTFAPDYLGMGSSRGFHPYVHAETEARAAHDMYRILDELIESAGLNVERNNQLFITGYSQGGHASMAYHKFLEEEGGIPVTAAAHLSGPYSLSGVMRGIIFNDEIYERPAFIANVILSFAEVYGLYENIEEILVEPYATWVQQTYDEQLGIFDLNDSIINYMEATIGESIPSRMLQDSIITEVSNNPNHPINLALQDNDLFNWRPVTPTLLGFCEGDETVNYRNAIVADSVMNALGAPAVTTFDGGLLSHGECVIPAMVAAINFFDSFKVISSQYAFEAFPELRMFPNPTFGSIYFSGIPQGAQLGIYNLQGQLLWSKIGVAETEQVSLNTFSEGMYLVRVMSENQIDTRKLVIQKG
jgi:pimeloyl-ACP methyl ester carboxylesterase